VALAWFGYPVIYALPGLGSSDEAVRVSAMRAQRPELKVPYLTDSASELETPYEQRFKMPLGPDVSTTARSSSAWPTRS